MSENLPGEAAELLASFVPGSRVAGYLLVEQIGAGGMAVVLRAQDERLGRIVALKILAPSLASDQRFRQRFIRESRAAAAVDDPHIVPVYEAGDAQGVLFIAMRYVRGGSVADLLHRHGPLSPERAAAIISPIASALDAAHAAGLVHRDVKPANMLVDIRPDRPDHVYLSDFGLTKGSETSIGLTGTGQVLGTPSYMAPEQIEGLVVDGRTDQYALACAAFEMLTGEVPFRRDQGLAVLWAHLKQSPPTVTSLRPDLGESVDRVFTKALAKVPEARYAACRDFADAFRESLALAPYHGRIEPTTSKVHASTASSLVVRPDREVASSKASADADADSPPADFDAGNSSGNLNQVAEPRAAEGDPGVAEEVTDIDARAKESLSISETLPRLVASADTGLLPSQQRLPTVIPVPHGQVSPFQKPDDSRLNVQNTQRKIRRAKPLAVMLGLSLLLIGGGVSVGYQVVRSQYYVGNDSGRVAIFRGINDRLFGVSLFSVYQSTSIPISGIPAAAAREIQRGNTGNLGVARQFVANIRAQYDSCQNAKAAVRDWLAHRPKPIAVKLRVNGRTVIKHLLPRYRPMPTIPARCPP